jgi:hypothetical protein
VDDTAAAIQALVAARRGGSAAVADAVRFLRSVQNTDGGFGQYDGRLSNAQSTAYAVQALVAAGRNPARFRRSGRSPVAYLRSLQRRNGSVRYSRSSTQTPVWVTAQAVLAFERKPFPLRAVRRERKRSAAVADQPRSSDASAGSSSRGGPASEPPRKDRPREAGEGEARVRSAQSGWTAYAPVAELAAAPSDEAPGGAGPSWLGVALTLAAAALVSLAARQVTRAAPGNRG